MAGLYRMERMEIYPMEGKVVITSSDNGELGMP